MPEDTQPQQSPTDTPIDTTQVDDTQLDTTKVDPPEQKPTEKKEEPLEVETRGFKKEETKDEEEEITVDPVDEKAISKIVNKQISPFQEQLQRQTDELEVNDYIIKNPEFAEYKPSLLKYVAHPDYKNVPIKFIAAGLASDKLLQMGAQREREAQATADSTRNGNNTARKTTSEPDWRTVSKADFEAERNKVFGRN